MRTLRGHISNIYMIIGIVSVFTMLIWLTGFLFGILTPHNTTALLAKSASGIAESRLTWWIIMLAGWYAAVWTANFLYKNRVQPPIQIKEDDLGAVEVAPEALCSLAKNEVRAQGVPGPCRSNFTRRLGSPMLQVWCDLTASVDGEEGLIAIGDRLKKGIERRLREDFNIKGMRVAIIHQPKSKSMRKPKPQPSA